MPSRVGRRARAARASRSRPATGSTTARSSTTTVTCLIALRVLGRRLLAGHLGGRRRRDHRRGDDVVMVDAAAGERGESRPARRERVRADSYCGAECIGPGSAGLPSRSVSRGLQALFVACILVASTAMFALAESRKLDRAPIKRARAVGRVRASRGSRGRRSSRRRCDCATSYARISFRLGKPGALRGLDRESRGRGRDARSATSRTCAASRCAGTATTTRGKQVPDGSYRLRIRPPARRGRCRCSSSCARRRRAFQRHGRAEAR